MHTRPVYRTVTRHLGVATLVEHGLVREGTVRRAHRVLVGVPAKARHLGRHLVAEGVDRGARLGLEVVQARRQLGALAKRGDQAGLAADEVAVQGVLRVQVGQARPADHDRDLLGHHVGAAVEPIHHVGRHLRGLLGLVLLAVRRRHVGGLADPVVAVQAVARRLRDDHVHDVQADLDLLHELRTRVLGRGLLRLLEALRVRTLTHVLPYHFLHMVHINNGLFTRTRRPIRVSLHANVLRTVRRAKC